jgi:hypothetical protein
VAKFLSKQQIEDLIDEIKDEIDRLHEIQNKAARSEAATELRDYIELWAEKDTTATCSSCMVRR